MIAPRRLAVVLGALLVASLAGNVLLALRCQRSWRSEQDVRLDPAGLRVYAQDGPVSSDRPVLVLFGDSRAAMWPAPALPGFTVVDRGVGNQTTAQILLRLDADVTPLHPAVVVLEAGVNDLKTIPDFPGRRASIVADCERNLQTLVARLREGGATVVVSTIFDIGDVPLWRRPSWSDEVPAAVREVNAFLHGLASERVRVFDTGTVLDDPSGRIRPSFQLDYLHLNPSGYMALNGALVPFLAQAQ